MYVPLTFTIEALVLLATYVATTVLTVKEHCNSLGADVKQTRNTHTHTYNVYREYFVVTKVAWAKCFISFNFVNLVGPRNFLTPEILLHEAFPCYVHVCSNQHHWQHTYETEPCR